MWKTLGWQCEGYKGLRAEKGCRQMSLKLIHEGPPVYADWEEAMCYSPFSDILAYFSLLLQAVFRGTEMILSIR